jgi:hypothetical protein
LPFADFAERAHGICNWAQHIGWLWRELPVPVIAAVHGVAFGGGFQLALGADLRYVAPGTLLSIMEMGPGAGHGRNPAHAPSCARGRGPRTDLHRADFSPPTRRSHTGSRRDWSRTCGPRHGHGRATSPRAVPMRSGPPNDCSTMPLHARLAPASSRRRLSSSVLSAARTRSRRSGPIAKISCRALPCLTSDRRPLRGL